MQLKIKISMYFMSILLIAVSGCASFNTWLPSSGPLREDVKPADIPKINLNPQAPTVQLIEVTDAAVFRINQSLQHAEFAQLFKQADINRNLVGPGDELEVHIWEASPALLFGASMGMSSPTSGMSTAKASSFPEQMVDIDGFISIPFAGPVKASGKTTIGIAQDIATVLQGKANQPQVLVRMTRNISSAVTVVGEVVNSHLIPLTAKQEKLLDAIAASGGVKQGINKITIQLARNGAVHRMPLESIIKDPKQNISLAAGDVITAYYQPYSFTALGATGQNQEVEFEGQGISLVQALARVGGVHDTRADAKGVFIFRFEDPSALPDEASNGVKTSDNKVPVIYRMNLSEGSAFLTAQTFPIKNKDVVYVSNASSVELQKFLNILVSGIYPVVNVKNLLKGNL
jgi:polysaccharide biosynthesis/export protein